MAKPQKTVSPFPAIRATGMKPAKATLKTKPEPTTVPRALAEYRERARNLEVSEHYLPKLVELSDLNILAELQYWNSRVRRERLPYPDSVPESHRFSKVDFFKNMKDLRQSILTGQRTTPLPQLRRDILTRVCIDLRAMFMPDCPTPMRKQGAPPQLKVLRQQRLAFDSDWDIIQRLASKVGERKFALYELRFVAENWLEAWILGPDQFEFEWVGQRSGAEKLLVDLIDRPIEYRPDQVRWFKQKTGFFHSIPLWKSCPEQTSLPDLDAVVQVRPPDEVVIQPPHRVNDGQLDLLAKLLLPWDGDGEQEELFICTLLPRLDPAGMQYEFPF